MARMIQRNKSPSPSWRVSEATSKHNEGSYLQLQEANRERIEKAIQGGGDEMERDRDKETER